VVEAGLRIPVFYGKDSKKVDRLVEPGDQPWKSERRSDHLEENFES